MITPRGLVGCIFIHTHPRGPGLLARTRTGGDKQRQPFTVAEVSLVMITFFAPGEPTLRCDCEFRYAVSSYYLTLADVATQNQMFYLFLDFKELENIRKIITETRTTVKII